MLLKSARNEKIEKRDTHRYQYTSKDGFSDYNRDGFFATGVAFGGARFVSAHITRT